MRLRAQVGTPRGRTGHRRAGSALAVVGLGLVLLVLHSLDTTSVLGQVTFVLGTGGAALVAWHAARLMPTAAARPWRLMGIGLALSALGDLYWSAAFLADGVGPDVSIADLGWLGSYLAIGAVLVLLLAHSGDAVREDIEGLIDMAVVVVVGVLVLWQLSFGELFGDRSLSLISKVVWASYPLLDLVLLTLVARTLLCRRARAMPIMLVAGGALLWLAPDLGYVLWAAEGGVAVAMDAGWMLGAYLLGAGAWAATALPQTRPMGEAAPKPPANGWRLALALAPLPLPAVLEAWASIRGEKSSALVLVGATLALTVCAFLRARLLLKARDHAERHVEASRRYYRALAANSSDAVLLLDARGRIMDDGPQLAELLGHRGTSLKGVNALAAVNPADAPQAADLFQRARSMPEAVFTTELRVESAAGDETWLEVRLVNQLDDPDVRGMIVNFHDITLRKRAEEELTHLAFHDVLTGLANRGLFRDRLEHALTLRGERSLAVVYLDLDGFKHVNDSLGHEAGDELLTVVARRLSEAVRPSDTVARLGGDEFAILLEHSTEPVQAGAAVAKHVLRALHEPIEVAGVRMVVSASIGVAVADARSSASSLLRDADLAMYQSKSTGRARWTMFDPAIRRAARARLAVEQALVGALERKEMRVVYQPVVALGSGALVGFEALLRWEHPTLGPVPPDRFIPIAEETGAIEALGRWVLDQATMDLARWRLAHPEHSGMSIAVNVSARQLVSDHLVRDVAGALKAADLPPEALVVELTETALIRDPETTARRLRRLHRLGVRLAVDDFGTGFSSLAHLRQFPVDVLKIDRSFVRTITHDGQVPALLHGLLELGHTMGLEIVAEGIEEEVQVVALHRDRCHLGQGFLFSPPVEREQVGALIARSQPYLLHHDAPGQAHQVDLEPVAIT